MSSWYNGQNNVKGEIGRLKDIAAAMLTDVEQWKSDPKERKKREVFLTLWDEKGPRESAKHWRREKRKVGLQEKRNDQLDDVVDHHTHWYEDEMARAVRGEGGSTDAE